MWRIDPLSPNKCKPSLLHCLLNHLGDRFGWNKSLSLKEYLRWIHFLSVDFQKDISTGEKPEKNNHDDSKPGEDINVRTSILV